MQSKYYLYIVFVASLSLVLLVLCLLCCIGVTAAALHIQKKSDNINKSENVHEA